MEKEIMCIAAKRSSNLDKLKVLCAFFVVCIHAPFPGTFGEYFIALTRIAVPIFFMISGYFYRFEKTKQQMIKILKLILVSNVLYFLLKAILTALKGEFLLFLHETMTVKNFVTFILFNDNSLRSHLWYLNAILYVLAIVALAYKWNLKKALYLITPVLLALDLVLGKYALCIFHREFPYILVRNWLFVGIPYFTIGLWIKEHWEIINERLKLHGQPKVSAMILLFGITTFLERYLLVRNGLNTARDHYLSTTFLAVAVFLFFLKYVSPEENAIARIGRNDSTYIYVFHPIVITIVKAVASKIAIAERLYTLASPFIIFLLTLFLIKTVTWVINKQKNKMTREKQAL